MRITIDTEGAAAVAPPPLAGSVAAAALAEIDAGAGASAPHGEGAAAPYGASGSADPASDTGGPPAWLVSAVGATRAASERIDTAPGSGRDERGAASPADAGSGPAGQPGDLIY